MFRPFVRRRLQMRPEHTQFRRKKRRKLWKCVCECVDKALKRCYVNRNRTNIRRATLVPVWVWVCGAVVYASMTMHCEWNASSNYISIVRLGVYKNWKLYFMIAFTIKILSNSWSICNGTLRPNDDGEADDYFRFLLLSNVMIIICV